MTTETYDFTTEDGDDVSYEMDYIEEVMDYVTSDESGSKYFQNKLARLCSKHFPSQDWSWDKMIDHWDVDDVESAIEKFEDK